MLKNKTYKCKGCNKRHILLLEIKDLISDPIMSSESIIHIISTKIEKLNETLYKKKTKL